VEEVEEEMEKRFTTVISLCSAAAAVASELFKIIHW
jgi:hypothetical protein